MNKSKKIKQLRNEKGITLIALVITIIILIILAGVSINILFDSEGLINKAKKAAENMEIAQVEEQEQLSELMNELEGVRGNKGENTQTVEYAPYNTPYIPNGFKYKEGEWNNGYTIIGETQSIGNEFVWVPCVLDLNKVRPRRFSSRIQKNIARS